ncbi:hypothetical protein PX860_07740 [Agrobacterium leguminum]|uniref:hypothetical protein n=1 Tax=Agrobacterium leguminum TaxID=2792015 RepID=UPI00272B67BF|nr:hypothetical protein [Agrobacterium leguminum]WLD98366.1 hypothetical protein PX860_07740 [Agrobacterium leguminum]
MGRAVWAIAVGVLVSLGAFMVLSLLGVGVGWWFLDAIAPTVSGVTKNTNTGEWGRMLLLPLSVTVGIVCGALVFDPGMSSKTEAIVVSIVFFLLVSVSGINFWTNDSLINVNAQLVIDVFLSISALAVIILLLRWEPTRPTTLAVQRVALFLITVFGFVLPLFYGTSLSLQGMGFEGELKTISDFIGFISAALGLAVAAAPNLLAKRS